MPSVDKHTWFPEDTRPAVGRQGERLAAVVITATHTLHRTVTSYWKKLAYPDRQGRGSGDRAAWFRGRAVNMASASEPKLEMLLKTKKPPWDSAQHGASLPLPAPQAGAPGQPPPPPCLACSDQSSFSCRLAGGLVLTPLLHPTAKKTARPPCGRGRYCPHFTDKSAGLQRRNPVEAAPLATSTGRLRQAFPAAVPPSHHAEGWETGFESS